MPSTLAMAPAGGAKLSPVLPATTKTRGPASLLPSSLSASSVSAIHKLVATSSAAASTPSSTMTKPLLSSTASTPSSTASPSTTASPTSVSTISIPVSAFHDPNSNVITITPYIFVKTATVAEQMQALRQDKKLAQASEPAGTGTALRVKRRADISSKLGLPEAKPASVSRRNARERNRVKQVNLGFETLREHVPNGKKNKKMSKVQTLRSAAQYIKDLYMILHGELPELGSPADIDENEPASPLDNSMCSNSDNDNDFCMGSPEQQQQVQPSQKQQEQEQIMQQQNAQDQLLQQQKREQEHEEQLLQFRQQQQLLQTQEKLLQAKTCEQQHIPMDTLENGGMSPSTSPIPMSPIFQGGQRDKLTTELQQQLQLQQQQEQQNKQQKQLEQFQQQKELQQKLLRQHQEHQQKQLLERQQQQQQQQEVQRPVLKSRLQRQRSTQSRQKQQPLILKKEPMSVLQQQLSRGHIPQLQRLQINEQAQKQRHQLPQQPQQQVQQEQPEQQQMQLDPEHNQQVQYQQQQLLLDQQQCFDPTALRADAMTCTSSNFGFSRSASTSSDVQLPDTPLSSYAGSGNIPGNSPVPGSPLVFGQTGQGDSPLPGTPTTFTELSPVSLDEEPCENYIGHTETRGHRHQALSDFGHTERARHPQPFSLPSSTPNAGPDNSAAPVDVPVSPSMLQPTYINDANMNIITSPTPNQRDFEALHSYYKAIHSEHFIKNVDDDVFTFEHRNTPLNNNNNSTINNNILNSNNNIINTNNINSSIAAILNNNSSMVNTLLNNSAEMHYSNGNNNLTSDKLTHSPTSSLGSTGSNALSDVDLALTGYNHHSYDYDAGCGANESSNVENYESLDGETLLDISNLISELCSHGMHGPGELDGYLYN